IELAVRLGSPPPPLPRPPSTHPAASWGEAIVMAHDQLGLNLVHGIHSHAHDDQERGTAEVEVHVQSVGDPGGQFFEESAYQPKVIEVNTADQDLRYQRDHDQIERAHQGKAEEDVIDEVGGAPSRTDAGKAPAVLAHIVGNVVGAEHDRDVEVGKENDAHDIKQLIPGLTGTETVENPGQEPTVPHKVGTRKQQGRRKDGAGEDDRHHSAGVDLERQMGGLASHQAASDNPLGILHRDAPFTALDKADEGHDGDHHDHQNDQGRNGEGAPRLGARLVNQILDAARQADDNAGEDEQAHAVADAAIGDLLTQPHDEGCTRGQGDHGHDDEPRSGVQDVGNPARAVGKGQGYSQRLHGSQNHGDVAGPLGDFAPT